MQPWDSLTVAEQTLIRTALWENWLAGTPQTYGAALRWAGVPDAPPRSYTVDEQHQIIPRLATTALDLAANNLLTVVHHTDDGKHREPVPPGQPLHQILSTPTNWIWNTQSASDYQLRAPSPVREYWFRDAFPTADTTDLPTWQQLSRAKREVLVCAAEASGMLTGSFGIWPDLPAGLQAAERQARVQQQVAPLRSFVRSGLIEVRHFPGVSDAYTVIPLDALNEALADPNIRGQGQDWGIGIGCVFTYDGLAVWRGGWGAEWHKRLTFD